MKKIFFTFILFFLFCININAQQSNKRVLVKSCVTSSCCDFFVFSVSVYSETVCHYIWVDEKGNKQNVVNIKLETKNNETLNSITVDNDIVLPELFDEHGKGLVLPKGTYQLHNNEFEFEPKTIVLKKYCYTRISNLTLLGVDMGSVITICIYIPTIENKATYEGKGNVNLSVNLSASELNNLKRNNYMINISNDINIEEQIDGIIFKTTLKAGEYKTNENGSITLQEVTFKK